MACGTLPDPGTASPQAARDFWPASLRRRVSISVEGLSVDALLNALSRKTGAALDATREMADDKVVVFGAERPLHDLLEDLAELLGGRWERREQAGRTGYHLTREEPVRKLAADLTSSDCRQWQAQAEARVRALRETPAQLARRPQNDPIREYLEDPGTRLATELFSRLTPAQHTQLFERGRLRIFAGTLSPQEQAAFRRLWDPPEAVDLALDPMFSREGFGATHSRQAPYDLEFQLDRHGNRHASLRIVPPLLKFADLRSRISFPKPHGNPYTGAPAHQGKLPLPQRVPVPTEENWTDQLRLLAQQTGAPVLADYYRLDCLPDDESGTPPSDASPGPADPAVEALDAFCRRDGSVWWTRGPSLLFRRRDWFQRQSYEVPDRWLAACTSRLRAGNGVPTLADVLKLSELTVRQQIGLQRLGGRNGAPPYAFEQDEEKLAGLPELLALVKGRQLAPGVARLRIARREEIRFESPLWHELTLTYTEMRPDQQHWLLPFLSIASRDLDGLPLEKFWVSFQAEEPRSSKRPGYLIVPVQLITWIGSPSKEQEIHLPLSLPDDRRSRTRIELAAP